METTAGIIARIKSDLALLESILTKDGSEASNLQVFEPNVEYKVGQIGTLYGRICRIEKDAQCSHCILNSEECSGYLCFTGRGRKDKTPIIFKQI